MVKPTPMRPDAEQASSAPLREMRAFHDISLHEAHIIVPEEGGRGVRMKRGGGLIIVGRGTTRATSDVTGVEYDQSVRHAAVSSSVISQTAVSDLQRPSLPYEISAILFMNA